jgi:hypothetical protein
MILDARSSPRRTRTYTCEAYFVKSATASDAKRKRVTTHTSLPPQPNRRLQSPLVACFYMNPFQTVRRFHWGPTYLKIGTAPSQTAHALIPLCQYSSSPFNPNRLALAPVATITASAVSGSSSSAHSRQYRNGRLERSILETVSVKMVVPKRSDCSRKRFMSSGPEMPSGNPG